MEPGHNMVLSASYGEDVIDFGDKHKSSKILLDPSQLSGNVLLSKHLATDLGNCMRISPNMFQSSNDKKKVHIRLTLVILKYLF